MIKTNTRIAGEFRIKVKNPDGTIRQDTGYQKNLILDSGLDYLASSNSSSGISVFVGVGTANTNPEKGQDSLVNEIGKTTELQITNSSYSYDAENDGNHYKIWQEYEGEIQDLGEQVIAEIGLGFIHYPHRTTTYFTRSLIKDRSGQPISLEIHKGDILYVYYRIYNIFELNTLTGQFDITVNNAIESYDYTMKLINLSSHYYLNKIFSSNIFLITSNLSDSPLDVTVHGIDIDNQRPLSWYNSVKGGGHAIIGELFDYTKGTFKRNFAITLRANMQNVEIKSIDIGTSVGDYKLTFSKQGNPDVGLTKLGTHDLRLVFEASWDRYEEIV